MVFAELAGEVALRLVQPRDGYVARLPTFLRARQADLEQARAEARLAGHEAGRGMADIFLSCHGISLLMIARCKVCLV